MFFKYISTQPYVVDCSFYNTYIKLTVPEPYHSLYFYSYIFCAFQNGCPFIRGNCGKRWITSKQVTQKTKLQHIKIIHTGFGDKVLYREDREKMTIVKKGNFFFDNSTAIKAIDKIIHLKNIEQRARNVQL